MTRDCILAQVQSFHRVHFYTPNWIMDKTMATNECKSVCGGGDAITTLTTIQKTTKKLPQKTNWSYKTINGVESSTTLKKTNRLRYRLTTTTQNTGGIHVTSRRRVYRWVCEGHGSSAPVCSKEIPKSLFFWQMSSFFCLLTLVHTISYSVKKRD